MKTKSGLEVSIPLGAMALGLESALGSAFLLLVCSVGATFLGVWAGEDLPLAESSIFFAVFSDPETTIFAYIFTFLLGFFSAGGFSLFICALTGLILFLKSTTLRLDGLFLLAFSCFMGGVTTSMDIYTTHFSLRSRVGYLLISLVLLYIFYRGFFVYAFIRTRWNPDSSDEIEFDEEV